MEPQNQQPNQQLSQAPIDEQKLQKSKRIKIVIFALAAFALVFGGIVILQRSQIPKNGSIDLIPPDTFSWQTYRNEEFGFEVRYPGTCSKILENNDSLFSVSCTVDNEEFVKRFVFSSWGHVGFSCGSIKECESGLNFSTIEYKDDKTAIIERTRNGNKEFVLVFIAKDTSLGSGIGEVEIQQKVPSGRRRFEEIATQILSTFRFVP